MTCIEVKSEWPPIPTQFMLSCIIYLMFFPIFKINVNEMLLVSMDVKICFNRQFLTELRFETNLCLSLRLKKKLVLSDKFWLPKRGTVES